MVRRNIIPRRLIGARGVRLFDIQGLKYPAEMLRAVEEEEVEDTPPAWGISTAEAAEILGCRPSSARMLLDKTEVRKCKVMRESKPPTWYWDKQQVCIVAEARRKEMREIPPKYMCAADVMCYLRISRSTLFRYVKDGLMEPVCIRHRTAQGLRLKHFFLRSDVRRFGYHLNAVKLKQREERGLF